MTSGTSSGSGGTSLTHGGSDGSSGGGSGDWPGETSWMSVSTCGSASTSGGGH